jgi:hypothetical protein
VCNLAVSLSFLTLTETITKAGTFWLYVALLPSQPSRSRADSSSPLATIRLVFFFVFPSFFSFFFFVANLQVCWHCARVSHLRVFQDARDKRPDAGRDFSPLQAGRGLL